MECRDSHKIKGLKIISPKIFYDFRGEVLESFSEDKYVFQDINDNPIKFVEDDFSISTQNVLRGLHGDAKTWKLVQCLLGQIYLVVVDMRKDSPTYLNWEAFTLNEKNRIQILVPAGCANGHLVLSERCIFSYKQSQYYSGMQNQFTVRWNEPKLNIFWPVQYPIVSERDNNANNL